MLKWFRLYNKYILAVGASLLMIAFLIQGTISTMGGGGRDFTIGTIDGEELKLTDQQRAAADVSIVAAVFSTVSPNVARIVTPEGQTWMLMTHEARSLGLAAGDGEVASLLQALGHDNNTKIKDLARKLKVTEDTLFHVLADWLMVEKYRELVLGQAHVSPVDRINTYVEVFNQFDKLPPYYQQMLAPQIMSQIDSAMQGRPRLSRPVMLRLASDLRSKVTIAAVPVAADPAKAPAPPTDAELTELFNQYKDTLPGEGKPYPFGYRFPDRVKIEFLALPIDRVRAAVRIDEGEAVRYYDDHKLEFVEQPPQPKQDDAEAAATQPKPQPRQKSYVEVRDTIISRLRREQADQLMQKILRSASALLQDNLRNVPVEKGYRAFPEGFTRVTLESVADQIQSQFELRPDVVREDSRWLDHKALSAVPGIGTASFGQAQIEFADYALALRELGVKDDNPLVAHRMQVGVPSAPISGYDGSGFIFRVIDAAAARTPQAVTEVREQVVADASRLAAYRQLLKSQAELQSKAAATPLEDLAKEFNANVIKPEPFARRTFAGASLAAPNVEMIGPDEPFVDRVFELAYDVSASGGNIALAPLAMRSAAIPSDHNLAVYLVRIDDYELQPQSSYDQIVGSVTDAAAINNLVVGSRRKDPFSYEALVERTGFNTDAN